MIKQLKVVFFGTPEFATSILNGIVNSNHKVVGVVTVADKPSGRGQKLNESHVKKYAVANDLVLLQPTNLKSQDFQDALRNLNADLFVVVAFRMLPKSVWSIPEKGTFNLHASLLPQYRGAAPINWAIINQEKTTGVSTFFIDEKIDTGAIIKQKECMISERETVGSLYGKLMELGTSLTIETIDDIASDKITTTSQKEITVIKEAPKLNQDNTTIDFSQTAHQVDALVRGLSPYPVAKAVLKNENVMQVKVFETRVVDKEHKMAPGSIVIQNSELWVACARDFVIIEKIQLPNKKAMLTKDLLNGFQFAANAIFDKGLREKD